MMMMTMMDDALLMRVYCIHLSRCVVTGDHVTWSTCCSTALTSTPSIKPATHLYTSVHLTAR